MKEATSSVAEVFVGLACFVGSPLVKANDVVMYRLYDLAKKTAPRLWLLAAEA